MFPTKKPRSFSRDFKLKVVKRMEAGELFCLAQNNKQYRQICEIS